MHTRGRPEDMYAHADYGDVVADVIEDLRRCVIRAEGFGISRKRLIVDPGLGFAKRAAQSMAMLAGLDRLAGLDLPILVGPSRKSFLAAATGPLSAEDRDWPTAAAVTAAIFAAPTSCVSMPSTSSFTSCGSPTPFASRRDQPEGRVPASHRHGSRFVPAVLSGRIHGPAP